MSDVLGSAGARAPAEQRAREFVIAEPAGTSKDGMATSPASAVIAPFFCGAALSRGYDVTLVPAKATSVRSNQAGEHRG